MDNILIILKDAAENFTEVIKNMDIQKVIAIAVVVILFIIIIKIFKAPIKFIFKILLNTVFGFIALLLFNYVGAFIGVALGINWINALVVGIFGVPGLALLLILQWLMVI